MSIEGHLTWLEEAQGKLLDAVAAVEAPGRAAATTSGGWSLLGVANHLMRVEQYASEQFLENRDAMRMRSLRDRLHFVAVRLVLASPVKVEVPMRAVDPAARPIALPELVRTWAAVRRGLHAAAATLTPREERICYLFHPYARHMTFENGLAFLVHHWRHHERQIESLAG